MTIIDDRGGWLPDGHPLKGMHNILGAKRPGSPADSPSEQSAPPPEGDQAQSREQDSQP